MKRFIAGLISFIYLFVATPVLPTAEAARVAITAPSAVLLDGSRGSFLYAKNSNSKRAPASTTKVLTAIVAVEHLKLNQVITIPKFAESVEPSKAYLRQGERYRAKDLIRAALIASANDAAEVLAVAVAGSRSKFARLMNKKARAIGARNSNFIRPSGLPAKGQYSTARDMAKIMRYAQRYPFIVEALKTKRTSIRSLTGRKIYLKNHNKMLWRDPREILGKTGWTRRARHCFVGYVNVYGRIAYIAMLGSTSLWRDIKRLVDYKFGKNLTKVAINKKLWSTAATRKIQKALKRAGYSPGSIDGKFGPKTLKAIRGFQAAKGLKQDGIVGPQTYGRLKPYF